MRSIAAQLRVAVWDRPVLSSSWDRLLWGLSGIAIAALSIALVFPAARTWVLVFLLVALTSGPTTILVPFAAEPLLMAFGQLHSPLALAVVGTAGMVSIEFFNLRLFGVVLHARPLEPVRRAASIRTFVRWFAVQPFLVIWVAAFTPLPFDLVRGLAVLSHYSVPRYLLGMATGRFPRVWLMAFTGSALPWGPKPILAVGLAIAIVCSAIVLIRSRWPHPHVVPVHPSR